MSPCPENYRNGARLALILSIALIAFPVLMNAQNAPASKPTKAVSSDDAVPKAELFLGYQWLNPGGDIPTPTAPPVAFKLPSI
jgi:hypothetical protein